MFLGILQSLEAAEIDRLFDLNRMAPDLAEA
jgi:hypothetical protein